MHFRNLSIKPQGRETLLQKWHQKWEPAEIELAKSFIILEDPRVESSEKKDLISRANTGSFWNKFGAIAGMFRAAQIYQASGSQGLALAVRNKHLFKPEH